MEHLQRTMNMLMETLNQYVSAFFIEECTNNMPTP